MEAYFKKLNRSLRVPRISRIPIPKYSPKDIPYAFIDWFATTEANKILRRVYREGFEVENL